MIPLGPGIPAWAVLFILVQAAHGKVEIGPTAVFSKHQALWPILDSASSLEAAALNNVSSPKPSSIFILPFFSVTSDEKPECDSCDRYSPPVLEFSLPNWHRDWFQSWSRASVEVLSPAHPLLMGDTSWFEPDRLRMEWPWSKWLDAPIHQVVFRNRGMPMPDTLATLLSVLGGKLGASHLVLFDSVQVRLRPWSRGSHHGSYRFSYRLVFWNVARSHPEWATRIGWSGPFWSDLNAPWDAALKLAFESWKIQIPQSIRRIESEEPR